jgi:hypothetical protein
MVSYLLIIVLNVIPSLYSPAIFSEKYWQVTTKSRLEISGTTNINEFHCLSVSYAGEDIMTEKWNKATQHGEISGEIMMKANGFDCHNAMMTRDFATTVKAGEFPEISIRFIALNKALSNEESDRFSGHVEITLAGKSKTYSVSCVVKEENDDSKLLEGNRTFYFSDFGLKPPQKLFGAVKVKDTVSVDFYLKLRRVQR